MNRPRTPFLLRWKLTSLRSKIATLFVVLFLLGATLQGVASYSLILSISDLARQQTQYEVAATIGRKLQPLLDRGASLAELKAVGDEVAQLSPDLAFYLLDAHGNIESALSPHSIPRYVPIPMAPILHFLKAPLDEFPIYDLNPAGETYQVFSAASLTSNGQQHYVYAVIDGAEPLARAKSIARDNSYIAQGGATVILSILAMLGVGFFALWILGRRFAVVMASVQRYGDGAFETRLPISGDDEIDQLSRTFNVMATRIESSIEQLKHRDRLRRDLIANISHDLRTPLSHIKLTTEELHEHQGVKETEILQVLQSSISVLEQLLRELFDLAKLEAEEARIECTYFSVEELLEDLAQRFQLEARAKQLHFSSVIVENLPMVYADPALISRALGNLLSNAIRYTMPGGSIELSATPGPRGVCIAIADTGVGIAASELPKLFDRYYRGDEQRPTVAGSTGLGLAIVKRIVELHHSTITVESIERSGTKFSFELPVSE